MSDPTVPFVDLAHLLPALAREGVSVERRGLPWRLLAVETEGDGSEYVIAHPRRGTMMVNHARIADLSLVLDPPTVRALAVVIAEAAGLDASWGATAWRTASGGALFVQTAEHRRAFTRIAVEGEHAVPALAAATDLPSALVAVARSLAGVRDV